MASGIAYQRSIQPELRRLVVGQVGFEPTHLAADASEAPKSTSSYHWPVAEGESNRTSEGYEPPMVTRPLLRECAEWDSNPHARRHHVLNVASLPFHHRH